MSATPSFTRARIASLLCAPVLALGALTPATAQLPRLPGVTITAPAPVQLDTGIDSSPLTLLANHVDVRVIGGAARVRTTLTWRNDGVQSVRAQLPVPLPSALAMVQQVILDVTDGAADGCGDEQNSEESGGLPDGVLDGHAVGLDGAGGRSGVHALQLRVRSGVHGAVLERCGLCPLSALRRARVGRDIPRILLLERRVVEGEVAHVGLTPKWVVGLFPQR